MSYPCNLARYGEEHEIFRHALRLFLEEEVERQITMCDRGTVEMVA